MVDRVCLLAVLPVWHIKYVKLSLAKIEIVVYLAVGDRRLAILAQYKHAMTHLQDHGRGATALRSGRNTFLENQNVVAVLQHYKNDSEM